MLDIELFRTNPEIIRDSEKRRFRETKAVEMVIEYDKKWREALQKMEKLKHQRNLVTKEIAELKKHGKSPEGKIREMKKVNEDIEKTEDETKRLLKKRDELRYKVGNILHRDVPLGDSEEKNKLIRVWGKAEVWRGDIEEFKKQSENRIKFSEMYFQPKSHVDILKDLNLGDTDKASEISGARFYYLKNELVSLNFGLLKFALDFMVKQGFTPMWTPFIMTKDSMAKAAELADFENQLYKIEKEDLFLIATAEQTLAAYHQDEVFDEKNLPKKYVGFSTNFRREAGSHGKDTKGIFRVHQFDKIEQFVFSRPEDSWEWFEKLIRNAEKIFQLLEIPYRVMSICSGEMNDNAAMKYDLEVWMPAQGRFREVVSCSNCTDYQPRKLNIRFVRKDGTKEFVHTLNSTALASQRTLATILENYQQEDGSIKIPKVLIPYTGFRVIRR